MKKINTQTEKITINVNHIDLGRIDILVDNSFYTNRSDFIRTAIRNELNKNEKFVNQTIEKNNFSIGISKYKEDYFKDLINKNQKINLKIIGLLIIEDDVSVELIKETVNTFDIKGTMIAPKEIKQYLSNF